MSSTQDESVLDDEATPSQSQIVPESTVAISTVDVVGEPINQVFFHLQVFVFFLLICFIFYHELLV